MIQFTLLFQSTDPSLHKYFPPSVWGDKPRPPKSDYPYPVLKMKSHKPSPQRVHLHAYEQLRSICTEIQRGRYPTKADLARIAERHPRTVQRDLEALFNRLDTPLEFDHEKTGFYFTDPAWQFPQIIFTESELISFFAAERILRRLGATSEVQLARSALRRLAAHLPDKVVVDVNALEDAITFALEPVTNASHLVHRSQLITILLC